MRKTKEYTRKTPDGMAQHYTSYQAESCEGCELRQKCHHSKDDRTVDINHTLRHLKQQAKTNLLSETGIYHRKKRCYEVEPVFANIKHNKNFRRFNLRGASKVEIETGLIALAHNLKKVVV